MIKMKYKFNPESFNYEKVNKFIELKDIYSENTYIKVIEYSESAYWYSFCYKMPADDRWCFGSSLYTKEQKNQSTQIEYCGLITNDSYATELIKHIIAAVKNESVEKEGKERLYRNINDKRFG